MAVSNDTLHGCGEPARVNAKRDPCCRYAAAAVEFIATSEKPTIADSRDLSSARYRPRWCVFAPFVANFLLHDVYKRARHTVRLQHNYNNIIIYYIICMLNVRAREKIAIHETVRTRGKNTFFAI
jgi:hypothetical protein